MGGSNSGPQGAAMEGLAGLPIRRLARGWMTCSQFTLGAAGQRSCGLLECPHDRVAGFPGGVISKRPWRKYSTSSPALGSHTPSLPLYS